MYIYIYIYIFNHFTLYENDCLLEDTKVDRTKGAEEATHKKHKRFLK